jgi:osmotically-inducible protein OsmY
MATTVINNLHARAQTALANSPFFELHELQVEPREGVLFISGNVSSFYHKQLAQEVVRSVCKEIEVNNVIQVDMDE